MRRVRGGGEKKEEKPEGKKRRERKEEEKQKTHAGPARHHLHPRGLQRALDQVDLLLGQEHRKALALLLEGREPVCFLFF